MTSSLSNITSSIDLHKEKASQDITKIVKVIDRTVDYPIQNIKEVEKIIEKPVEVVKEVEKIIEKPVEVVKEVEKIIEKPVEVVREVNKVVRTKGGTPGMFSF